LSTGVTVRGSFFLSGSHANHSGPERIADLLNAEAGFFPFELSGDSEPFTALYNRAQVVVVTLLGESIEAQLDPGYDVATVRDVRLVLSSGHTVIGRVRVYRPLGRDRLSDYARLGDTFRYVETTAATVIVNTSHIVELRETSEA
jgi:hypothetical protein